MGEPTRWVTQTPTGHSQWYVERMRRLSAEGADLAGEARLLDAMVAPGSRILDAGCGTGRVCAALAARGHAVVGFATDRDYPLADFDLDIAAAGFRLEHRFATWDLRPWRPDADFAVSVLRLPAPSADHTSPRSEQWMRQA